MAEESRDSQDTAGTGTGASSQQPKGIILDKDGKPCRSCNSGAAFSAWVAQTKQKTTKDKAASTSTSTSTAPPSTANTNTNNHTTPSQRADCPPDVEVLGRSSWTLLHSIAASYPDTPSRTQQADLLRFVDLFARLYPCWVCAEDFQAYASARAPAVASRDDFGRWLCGAHNDVNRKLGKQEFDCSRWLERWKTGPKDGRCD